jgi:hypothetical protein
MIFNSKSVVSLSSNSELCALPVAQLEESKDALPVHRIPMEILAQILLEDTSGDSRRAFKLSAVCARWRHVALSTHRLWSHIKLPAANRLPDAAIATQLLYSHAAPLKVECWVFQDNRIPGVLDAVLAQLERVHALILVMEAEILENTLRSINATTALAPIIEELVVNADWRQSPHRRYAFKPATPVLRRLVTSECVLDLSSGVFGPWLRELDVDFLDRNDRWTLAEWQQLLQCLTGLELLRSVAAFDFLDPELKTLPLASNVHQRTPFELEIVTYTIDGMNTFAQLFRADVITSLTLEYFSDMGDDDSEDFSSVISWAQPFFSRAAISSPARSISCGYENSYSHVAFVAAFPLSSKDESSQMLRFRIATKLHKAKSMRPLMEALCPDILKVEEHNVRKLGPHGSLDTHFPHPFSFIVNSA